MSFNIRSGFEGDLLLPWKARKRNARYGSVETAADAALDIMAKFAFGLHSMKRPLHIEVYNTHKPSEAILRYRFEPAQPLRVKTDVGERCALVSSSRQRTVTYLVERCVPALPHNL